VDSLQGATDKQRKDFCNSRLNTLKGASSDLYNGGGKYVVSFVFDVGGPELDCDMVVLGPASLQQAAVHAKHSMRALLLHERSQQGMAAIDCKCSRYYQLRNQRPAHTDPGSAC
jgi:hypothetical protein